MSIEFYESQALKPRGLTVRERLIFLQEWYSKASQNESHDNTQKMFLEKLEEISEIIMIMNSYKDEYLPELINIYSNIYEALYDDTNINAHKAAYAYASIELKKCLEL